MTTEETVSAAEANRQFSRILRDVREGRSYVVTSHGTPVARIVPARQDDAFAAAAQEALLTRLRAQPVVVLGRRWSRDELYDG
jgi:prevent-host-death family protein